MGSKASKHSEQGSATSKRSRQRKLQKSSPPVQQEQQHNHLFWEDSDCESEADQTTSQTTQPIAQPTLIRNQNNRRRPRSDRLRTQANEVVLDSATREPFELHLQDAEASDRSDSSTTSHRIDIAPYNLAQASSTSLRSQNSWTSFSTDNTSERIRTDRLSGVESLSAPRETAEPMDRYKIPECIVCGLTAEGNLFPYRITMQCSHGDVCVSCLRQHIMTASNEYGWERVRCPSSNCTAMISYDDARAHLTATDFARYDSMALRALLSGSEHFHRCLTATCDYGVETTENHLYCPNCQCVWCLKCGVKWHDNQTCLQFQASKAANRTASVKVRDQQNQASRDTISKVTKGCPKCGVRIEKNDGCSHMTCKYTTCSILKYALELGHKRSDSLV